MKMKNEEDGVFRRTKMYKLERDRDKELCQESHLLFGLAVICFLLLFAGIGIVGASDYYVATWGNDSMAGTLDAPWQHPSYAVQHTYAGDTIYLINGTWSDEHMFFSNSGTEGNPITVIAYNGTPTLNGNSGNAVQITSKSYITIDGLKIEGYDLAFYLLGQLDSPMSNITLTNNIIDNTSREAIWLRSIGSPKFHNISISNNVLTNTYMLVGSGGFYQASIAAMGVLDSEIKNNTISVTGAGGYLVSGIDASAYNLTIEGNYIEKTSAHGISFNPGNTGNIVISNYLKDLGKRGIRFEHSNTGMAIGNIIENASSSSINMYGGSHTIWKDNIIRGSGPGYGTPGDEGSVLLENNTFSDPYDGNSFIEFGGSNVIFRNNRFFNLYKGLVVGGTNWTIENNVFVNIDSYPVQSAFYGTPNATIKNNIFMNTGCINNFRDGTFNASYNDVWNSSPDFFLGNVVVNNILYEDPLFANISNKDFHLKSQYRRWNGSAWVTDSETSPCIDAGELNAEKINMGAYGNTAEASKGSNETTTHPTITQYSPTGVATPVETTIKVTFSKAMNTVSTENAFSIFPDVSGTFSWIGTNEMIFTPDSNLDYERTYTVFLNTTAEDLEGNNMQSPFNWQFTTLAPGMNLIGEWHFDEGSGVSVEDTSVNANNGTLVNMDVTAWVPGKNGTALQFDGVDDSVDCGNDPVLDLTDAITIETWLNPNVAGEGGLNAAPVCKAEAEVDWSWQLRYNAPGGYMGFQFNGDPEGSTWVSVNQNLTPGDWYHVAGTFDGTTLRCYLNGIETDTNLLSAIKGGNATLFIGQDGWGNIFNGVVDEVKIYNRALSAEEIEEDYDAGLEDITSPTTTYIITPAPNAHGWNNVTPVVVTFFRSDNSSGISYTNYSKTSETGPWTTVTIDTATGPDAENVTDISENGFHVTVLDEGNTTIWYYSVDTNSNVEATKNVTVKIDTTKTLSGTVTTPDSAGIPNATVRLATVEGTEINTTQTDSTGNYTFTDISAGTYNLTVKKPRFWPTNNITVTTGNTEDIMLWLKGDLNLNGTQADSSDLLMMNYAATGRLIPDWKFDLNGNGDLADAGDVLMLEEAAAGKIELW